MNRDFFKTSTDDQGNDALLSELSRVLDSETFRRSPGLSELLDYLARRSLEAPTDPISEYAIAQDLLSKGSDFDPKADPVVRVRIKRLRDALEKFYLAHPTRNRLAVPPGAYDLRIITVGRKVRISVKPVYLAALLLPIIAAAVWLFRPISAQENVQRYPLIEVLPFQNLTDDIANAELMDGIRRQIVTDLQRFGRLRVFQSEPSGRDDLTPDFTLSGSILDIKDQLDLSFRLDRVADQELIYSRRIRDNIFGENYFDAIAEVSRRVTGEIGSRPGPMLQPPSQGSVARVSIFERDGVPTNVFECITLESEFFSDYAPERLVRALNCFEAIRDPFEDDPTAATSYWNLRYHSVPEFDLMNTSALPLELRSTPDEVLANAVRIVSQYPQSSDAYLLLGSVQLSLRQFVPAEISMRQSIQLNPGSPVAHAVLAYIAITVGDADAALEAGEEAIRLSARPQGWMYLPVFLAALVVDDIEAAVSAGNAYIATHSDMSAKFVGLIVARLVDNATPEERLLNTLMESENPFEGYGSFVQAENVQSALQNHVPELFADGL